MKYYSDYYEVNAKIEDFFRNPEKMDLYYDLLFKISMNVPRIMGFILHYCYPESIARDKPISGTLLKKLR